MYSKLSNWRFVNFVVLIFTACSGLLYVSNTWSPSAYSHALVNIFRDNSGVPDWGTPKPIRSDEWAVVTPLTQATVNNDFQRYNQASLYREDLRINYGLPIHDWGIVFKPTMWLYGWVNPAYAYSVHWFTLTALFIFGYAWLLRWLGAGPVVGFSLAIGLYFTGFVQFWWNEKGPIFALFPWIILPFATRLSMFWKVALMYWVATTWLLTNFYPPIQLSLAFIGLIFLFAREPALFKPKPLFMLCIAAALSASTAAVYLWDYLQATATTIYPGSRRLAGGTVEGRYWLSWLFPALNFDRNYESLIGRNICEIGTVGLYYPLLMFCFVNTERWRELLSNPQQRRLILTMAGGWLLMACWMILPLPAWAGAPLLWNRVQPERMQYAAGLLSTFLVFVMVKEMGLRVTLVRTLTFCTIIFLGWLTWNNKPGQRHFEDFAILILILPALSLARIVPRASHASLATASMLAGIMLFGRFNPLQSAWPIFNHRPNNWTQAMDMLQAQNNGVLAVPNIMGAVANGMGYRSVSHVTAVPQLNFWRQRFPNLPPTEFDMVFNRYSHIVVLPEDTPRLVSADVVGVPEKQFQSNPGAPVRYAPSPSLLVNEGYIDSAIVVKNKLTLTGWGTWTGPIAAHELEVTIVPAAAAGSSIKRSLMLRTDLPGATGQKNTVLNGFQLTLELPDETSRPAVCLVAYDRSTGRRTLLGNPDSIPHCPGLISN